MKFIAEGGKYFEHRVEHMRVGRIERSCELNAVDPVTYGGVEPARELRLVPIRVSVVGIERQKDRSDLRNKDVWIWASTFREYRKRFCAPVGLGKYAARSKDAIPFGRHGN